MPNASRPETTPGLTVRSGICEMCQWLWLSPAPSTRTGRFAASRLRAAVVITTAALPSVIRQQSRRRKGLLTISDARTSSTLSGSRTNAFGLSCAHRRAATATSAICAAVVPH